MARTYSPVNARMAPAKGQVSTPAAVVDLMVEKLFSKRTPKPADILVDAGCGEGAFIEGVLRYCKKTKIEAPRITGIELDSEQADKARKKFENFTSVEILEEDYLDRRVPSNFIIGNPPYVSITGIDAREKSRYRTAFTTAVERFDLYILFFEQSVANLKPNGRLCLITPEKFEYVHTATRLRRLLASLAVEELCHVDEEVFAGLVTYPTITVIEKRSPRTGEPTLVRFRDRRTRSVQLPRDGSAWSGAIRSSENMTHLGFTLGDICQRISAGVATGADAVFVHPKRRLPQHLRRFGYPTVSGRQLGQIEGLVVTETMDVMLVPYNEKGELLPQAKLGTFRNYLIRQRQALESRTCVTKGKRRWYSFHENIPLEDILKPKILCKDIAREPVFWADRSRIIVPRHSVYYIVPKENVRFDELVDFLNSEQVGSWLKTHCQLAANGFYRLQSSVIKRLPIPRALQSRILKDYQSDIPNFVAPQESVSVAPA